MVCGWLWVAVGGCGWLWVAAHMCWCVPVFEILARVHDGATWQDAFMAVLPQRKGAVVPADNKDGTPTTAATAAKAATAATVAE